MTMQPDLLSWRSPPPQSILGDRQGNTYCRDLDLSRLNKQALAVWNAMADGAWHTPAELEAATGYNWASINARQRDFRKSDFGSHTVLRERLSRGLFQYKLIPNRGKA